MSLILSHSPYIEAVPAEKSAVWRIWYSQSGCLPTEERLTELKGYIESLSGERILLDVECGRAGLITMLVSPLSRREHDDIKNYLDLVALVLRASCPDSPNYCPNRDILQIITD